MNKKATSKKFIFNEKIDRESLFSLYEDDYTYIEEVFSITLENFDTDFEYFKSAYSSGNLDNLRRAAHKIKPTFGFTGLPQVQQLCKNFEDLCQKSNSITGLQAEYQQIVTTLAESKELIVTEHQKLKAFNANPL